MKPIQLYLIRAITNLLKSPRLAHKRGTLASKRGISKERECVPSYVNLDEESIAKTSNIDPWKIYKKF